MNKIILSTFYSFISITIICFTIFLLKSKLNSLQKEEIALKNQYIKNYRHHIQLPNLRQTVIKLQRNRSIHYLNKHSIAHFFATTCQSHRIKLNDVQPQSNTNPFSLSFKTEMQGSSYDLVVLLIQWIHYFNGLSIQSLNWTIHPDSLQNSMQLSFII